MAYLLFHDMIVCLIIILVVPNVLVLVLSLFYVVKLFRSNLKYYRYYKYVAILDTRLLVRILFNLKTELYKYFLLGIILLAELSIELSFVIIASTSYFYFYYNRIQVDKEINDTYFNCTKGLYDDEQPIILVILHPGLIIIPILVTLLFIILLQLFSFLCTYLKKRYNGYSLDNRVVSRYVVWWCIQAVLLLICAIPYMQVLIAVICPMLLLINWIILVTESRRLSRAIRSVLYEILHFEYDDVRYKASYASYKTYRMFIRFQLLALLFVISLITIFACNCIVHYFIIFTCKKNKFMYFRFEIKLHSILIVASQISAFFKQYFAYLSLLFYELCNIAPVILLAFVSLSRYFSKKMKLLKFDRHLAQTLL